MSHHIPKSINKPQEKKKQPSFYNGSSSQPAPLLWLYPAASFSDTSNNFTCYFYFTFTNITKLKLLSSASLQPPWSARCHSHPAKKKQQVKPHEWNFTKALLKVRENARQTGKGKKASRKEILSPATAYWVAERHLPQVCYQCRPSSQGVMV